MKKIVAILLLAALLLSLCACKGKKCDHQYTESVTKEATCAEEGEKTLTCSKCNYTYTEAIEKRDHSYMDADCVTPKTCVNCDETQGRAKGHKFVLGVCKVCEAEQEGYKALTTTTWRLEAVTYADDLEVIELRLSPEGNTIHVDHWAPLSRLSAAKQEELKKNPENIRKYKRVEYYYQGFSDSMELSVEEFFEDECDTAIISVIQDGGAMGTIELKRKNETKYTISEITGVIMEDIVHSCLAVDAIFNAVTD